VLHLVAPAKLSLSPQPFTLSDIMSSKSTVRKSSVRQKKFEAPPPTASAVHTTTHSALRRSSPRKLESKSSRSPSHMGVSSGALRGTGGNYSVSLGKRKLGFGLRVSGTEYIGAVIVPESEDTESIYYQRTNPAGPNATRLRNFATIYERWHAVRYSYRFTSSTPTSTPGTLCFGQDPDPTATYVTNTSGNIARLRCLPGSSLSQAWQNTVCHLPSTADYTSLWTVDNNTSTTNDSDRLDLAGQFVVACAASTGLPAGQVLGILELDYEIEFYSPKLFVGALERTTEFFFPSTGPTSGPAPFPPSSTGPSIVDAVISAILAAFPTLASTALTHVLREFIPGAPVTESRSASETKSRSLSASFSDDRFGFPVGNYRVAVTFAATSYTAWEALYLISPTAAPSNWNVDYGDGSASPSAPQRQLNWIAPSGQTYAIADTIAFDFGVSSGRGLRSGPYSIGLSDEPLSSYDVWVSIQTASTSSYFNSASTTPGMPVARKISKKPHPPLPPIPEGKEESKKPVTESDDDGVVVITTSPPHPPATPPPIPATLTPASLIRHPAPASVATPLPAHLLRPAYAVSRVAHLPSVPV
jgi:hypothetical protein